VLSSGASSVQQSVTVFAETLLALWTVKLVSLFSAFFTDALSVVATTLYVFLEQVVVLLGVAVLAHEDDAGCAKCKCRLQLVAIWAFLAKNYGLFFLLRSRCHDILRIYYLLRQFNYRFIP